MTYAIILAGGIGSRFWPLSTAIEPKQFLNLYSEKSLLMQTIERVSGLIDKENVYIATNKVYKDKIKDCIRKFPLPPGNFLFEPESKNTLAPIGVLARTIFEKDKEAVIIVLPSDHLIKKEARFRRILKKGIVTTRKGFIVTLGIKPTRIETGYGYIKIKSPNHQITKSPVYSVDRFIEKPNATNAKKFIRDKRYYWNGGIFIFKAEVILSEIERLLPSVYKNLIQIRDKQDLNRYWSRFPSVSIDYAIMERTKKIALLPADCGWIDLGSWEAIEEMLKRDKYGNISRGNHIDLGSRNITVWAGNKTVATLGLNDLIVVNTDSGLLVCAKERTQDVKRITQILKNRGRL